MKSLCKCMDIEGVEAANAFCTLYKRVAKTKILAGTMFEVFAFFDVIFFRALRYDQGATVIIRNMLGAVGFDCEKARMCFS